MSPEFLQVQTTLDDQAVALRLAEELVDKRLAACVQISSPVTSVYSWEGKLHHDTEFVLVIKTTVGRYAAIEQFLATEHPYDEPQIIALPIVDGSNSYLQWLISRTS